MQICGKETLLLRGVVAVAATHGVQRTSLHLQALLLAVMSGSPSTSTHLKLAPERCSNGGGCGQRRPAAHNAQNCITGLSTEPSGAGTWGNQQQVVACSHVLFLAGGGLMTAALTLWSWHLGDAAVVVGVVEGSQPHTMHRIESYA